MRKLLRPTYTIASFAYIDPKAFKTRFPGIAAVTMDADKTLVGQNEPLIPEAHLKVMKGLQKAGLKLAILSNADNPKRVQRVHGFSKQAREVGLELAVFTSSMEGHYRKPHTSLYKAAVQSFNLKPEQVVHFGDQILKDVLGANLAGYGGAVLVAPYGKGDHSGVKLLQRPIEALIRPAIGLPLRTKFFPEELS